MAASGDALRVEGVVKAFGATVALDGASFAMRAGEVHALLGENGAGKSTTVKLLSGLVQPDSGTIELSGERVRLAQRPQHPQPIGQHRRQAQSPAPSMPSHILSNSGGPATCRCA